ncbi:MAG: DUF4040 domain-containing protein [Acidobacteria bacterium]|nr:DUF4040 domain-containing protein [Acidobacteriota bacterium]
MQILLLTVIGLPVLGALLVASTRARGAPVIAALALGGSAAAAFGLVPAALASPVSLHVSWAAPLGPDLCLRADALGLILALLVGLIGAAVAVYCGSYLHEDRGLGRLLSTLLIFASAMQLLALADDVWLVFVAWEMTSVCSYLLVMHTRTAESLKAATTALLVTGLGGLSLLAGLVLTEAATGTARLSGLASGRGLLLESPLFVPALVCIVLGAATKSALFPFHFWLPGAMAAPSPVSAYLHAATMVKAGIFLLARVHPAFGGTALWEGLLGTLAALTVITACRRLPSVDDLKQLLAWSTVLALGTLATLLALDGAEAALALVVLLIAHAGYKGTLFLVVGSVDHGTGTRSLTRLGGLRRLMPWTAAAALLGAGSMMGLPPFAGFVAKEQVKLAGSGAGFVASAVLLLSAVALVAVAFWTGIRPFWGRSRDASLHPHESGPGILIPTLFLSVSGLVLGIAGAWLLSPLAQRAASDLAGAAVDAGLSPLPGGLAKAAVAGAILSAGLLAAAARDKLAALLPSSAADVSLQAWNGMMKGLIAAGRASVHVMQHGDLRGYLAVALLGACALALPGLARIAVPSTFGGIPLWMGPLGLMLIVGSLVAATARRRLAAVAGLGAVGYGISLIFLGLGAPDLALTQVLVETLTVVLFVLAFRHLPSTALEGPGPRRFSNLVAALLAGIAATLLVLAAQGYQISPHIGGPLIEAAWERGRGANAVNVILVDIRALDTMGEITVLMLAAIGVTALVLPAARPGEPLARSPILSAASRVILPLAILLGLFFWWRGHNAPGGGFAGGLCAGAAVILVAAARGGAAARRVLALSPLAWAASGLGLVILAGLLGVLWGHGFLFPLWLGPVGTPMLFDLGVMALVLGIVTMAVERLLEAEEGTR